MGAAAEGRVTKRDLTWRFGPIDPAAMRTLADVLNDPNPIHLDAEAVKAAGLGDRVINQGPANLAYVFNMLEEAGLEVTSLEARFTGNVRGGDMIEAQGAVEAGACAFNLVTGDGVGAITGSATVKARPC